MFVTDLLKKLENKGSLRATDFINAIGNGQLRGPVTKNESKRFFELSSKLRGISKTQEQAIETTSSVLKLNGKSRHWPSLDPNLVACQMMIRILDPLKFAQEGFNLCGPAALASVLTRSHPTKMAKFAYDLLSHGEGTIEGKTLKPHKSIRLYDPTSIRQCDWLIMATLRDKQMLKEEENGKYGLSKASDMRQWLKDAGFATVCAVPTTNAVNYGKKVKWLISGASVDYHPRKPSFVNKTKNQAMDPATNLALLKSFYDRGCTIFLITSEKRASGGISHNRRVERQVDKFHDDPAFPDELLEKMAAGMRQQQANVQGIGQGNSTGGKDSPDHWVLVEEMVLDYKLSDKVAFKIFTFGTSVRIGPFDFKEFFKDYGGFVAADSRAVAAVEKKVN